MIEFIFIALLEKINNKKIISLFVDFGNLLFFLISLLIFVLAQ